MTAALLGLGLLLMLGPAPRAAPAGNVRTASFSVQGQLRSAGLRTPIAGARVFATARRGATWSREASTGEDGSFVLTDLPSRDFRLTIVAAGHERLEQPTVAAYWTGRRPPIIYLQSTGAGRYRTIVAAGRDVRPSPVSNRLSPEEVATLPGSQGDPLRALQNLPGMARIPGGLGLLVMRGATPNQSQVFLGEHPIPRAFHFPGLASVVPGVALSGITYTPGNFDSSYGNAVGGIVALTPRTGRRDGIHGMAKFDLAAAGASIEGPMRKGSFLIAAQRGYLDLVLKALEPTGLRTVLPRYHDYQIVFDHPIGRGASVTTRFIGASDTLRYPIGYNSDFEVTSAFHRIDLSLRKRMGGWDFLLAPALRLDRGSVGTGDPQFIRRHDTVGLLRAEMTARPSRRLALTVGVDTQLDRYTAYSSFKTMEMEQVNKADGLLSNSGLYVTPVLALKGLTVSPGVRVSVFTGERSQRYSVDPRLVVRWNLHRKISLSAGAGQYSQPSQRRIETGSSGLFTGIEDVTLVVADNQGSVAVLPGAVRYLDSTLGLSPQGPVGLSQAAHVSGGVHVEIVRSLGLDATAFYRRVRDGLPPPPQGSDLPNTDTGSITYGVEALLRKQLTRRLYGWVAYTWMRSEKGTMTGESLTRRRAADFDQRHNFIVVVNIKLPRRWEIGGRFRVVTGLPFTPILGGIQITDSLFGSSFGSGAYPLLGRDNSARMATFHQLDLRADKTWVLRRSIVSAYLDVQNVYNRQNPEALIYNPHFTGTKTVAGLPILPVFGVRVEY